MRPLHSVSLELGNCPVHSSLVLSACAQTAENLKNNSFADFRSIFSLASSLQHPTLKFQQPHPPRASFSSSVLDTHAVCVAVGWSVESASRQKAQVTSGVTLSVYLLSGLRSCVRKRLSHTFCPVCSLLTVGGHIHWVPLLCLGYK